MTYPTLDPKNWRECDVNLSSWWDIASREKSEGHDNSLHGNFIPQIPADMIFRYTQPGDWVLDCFLGSGTTLVECIKQGRNGIGIELDVERASQVAAKISDFQGDSDDVDIMIEATDCMDCEFDAEMLALTLLHPPYLDIIKFSDDPLDWSNMDPVIFLTKMRILARKVWHATRWGGHVVLVIGDVWDSKAGALRPLGFECMTQMICSGWKLRATIVKNVVNTRKQQKDANLWKSRALKNGTVTFAHEYVFVFKKMKTRGEHKQKADNPEGNCRKCRIIMDPVETCQRQDCVDENSNVYCSCCGGMAKVSDEAYEECRFAYQEWSDAQEDNAV